MEERILCAAIWYQDGKQYNAQPKNIELGYVFCGRRHHNIIQLHFQLTGIKTIRPDHIQGFLTSLDRFVDRYEGNEIAIKTQQTNNMSGSILFSENLY